MFGGLYMIRNWLRNFMIGRYGVDQLYLATFIAVVIFSLLASITKIGIFSIISLLFLVWALFRCFSKNIYKRRAENDRFLRFWWPVRQRFVQEWKRIKSSKTHRFFKCPACKNILRVPKGKGKIQITCPKCGERFVKKT